MVAMAQSDLAILFCEPGGFQVTGDVGLAEFLELMNGLSEAEIFQKLKEIQARLSSEGCEESHLVFQDFSQEEK